MNCMNNYNSCMPSGAKQYPADQACVKKQTDISDKYPLAMAYVPRQHFTQTFSLDRGLRMGTIFPELCLPFCGVRRNCSCRMVR